MLRTAADDELAEERKSQVGSARPQRADPDVQFPAGPYLGVTESA